MPLLQGTGLVPWSGNKIPKAIEIGKKKKTKNEKRMISANSWLLINRNLYKDMKICIYICVHKYAHILCMYIYDMYGFKYMYIP